MQNTEIDYKKLSATGAIMGSGGFIVMDETEIIKEFEAGEDIVFSYEIVGKHEFYVKILCEKARVEIEVDRTIKPIVWNDYL